MSALGPLGQFGNQILQYAFLRDYARRHDLALETPHWLGRDLFGLDDPPISRARPIATELELGVFAADEESRPPRAEVDLWGWFQVDTRRYAGRREELRSALRPRSHLAARLEEGERRLRARGRTLVGVHLRRGDFRALAGHPLLDRLYPVTPAAAYLEWLESVWDELPAPVVFVASDEPESAAAELARFRPVTARDLGLELPEAPFCPDFHLLTRCHALAISNSTFSFAASLLASEGERFVRPDPETGALMPFDPWSSPPQLALDPAQALARAGRAAAAPPAAAARPGAPPIAARIAVRAGAPVTAIFADRHRRGRLEVALELPRAGGEDRVSVTWRDADEAAWDFRFASGARWRRHADRPPICAGAGEATGELVSGPAHALLVAAQVPGRAGEAFLAFSLLTPGLRSFFVEAVGAGAVESGG